MALSLSVPSYTSSGPTLEEERRLLHLPSPSPENYSSSRILDFGSAILPYQQYGEHGQDFATIEDPNFQDFTPEWQITPAQHDLVSGYLVSGYLASPSYLASTDIIPRTLVCSEHSEAVMSDANPQYHVPPLAYHVQDAGTSDCAYDNNATIELPYRRTKAAPASNKVLKSESNHQCLRCPKSFPLKKTLNRHLKTVHNNGVFCCTTCSIVFKRKDILKRHGREQHGSKTGTVNVRLAFSQ